MYSPNEQIHSIVAKQASASAILHRFEIDAQAQGADTVAEACAKRQLSLEQVLERLDEAEHREDKTGFPDVTGYSLTRLIQYVVRVHHRYIREQLPGLISLARNVRETEATAELDDVVSLLETLRSAMLDHFVDEEQVLFPYIARLDEDIRSAYMPASAGMRTMALSVFVMAQEHESVERLLQELEDRTNGFALPESASASYTSLISGLRRFKLDLERHLELEDDVLFPRALELETSKGL